MSVIQREMYALDNTMGCGAQLSEVFYHGMSVIQREMSAPDNNMDCGAQFSEVFIMLCL